MKRNEQMEKLAQNIFDHEIGQEDSFAPTTKGRIRKAMLAFGMAACYAFDEWIRENKWAQHPNGYWYKMDTSIETKATIIELYDKFFVSEKKEPQVIAKSDLSMFNAIAYEPTCKLRWTNHPIQGNINNKILEQWWQELNSPNGEWREVEIHEN